MAWRRIAGATEHILPMTIQAARRRRLQHAHAVLPSEFSRRVPLIAYRAPLMLASSILLRARLMGRDIMSAIDIGAPTFDIHH